MSSVATRITRVTLAADRVIEELGSTGNGATIRVQNIVVSNGTNNAVEVAFLDNDDTNILNITVGAQDTEDFNVAWIADNGLKIDASAILDADVVVTVLHGAPGA